MQNFAVMIYPYIFFYLAVINVLALILMGYDKLASKTGNVKLRIPEKTLLFLNVIGGALGGLIAMFLFRHKTRHLSFRIIIPLFFVIWAVISIYILIVNASLL